MDTVLRSRADRLQVLLSYGFRPFFLGAALWGAIAIALWIAILTAGVSIPTRFDPLIWHIHEMLFGFVMAAMAGFLLTVVVAWTGRKPVSGAWLGVPVALWLLGRLELLISQWSPVWFAITADVIFPLALTATTARELIAANNRRNFLILAPLRVLTATDLPIDLSMEGQETLSGYGWRLVLTAILIMISAVGGRIIPSFTRNWLVARGETRLPAPTALVDPASLGVLHATLLVWVLFPTAYATGIALPVAAVTNLWRLVRWRGAATRSEPLLAIMRAGYGWLVLGVGALGFASIDTAFPLDAAVHALTVGAIGTMILAVMTRVSRGHTGRRLSADRTTTGIYVLVILAACARVSAALAPGARENLLLAAAAFWIAAFTLFALRYAPCLLQPRSLEQR